MDITRTSNQVVWHNNTALRLKYHLSSIEYLLYTKFCANFCVNAEYYTFLFITLLITIAHHSVYSILFFPSSALKKVAVLAPLSCLTKRPSNGSFFSFSFVILIPSVAHGRGLSFGQLTYSVSTTSHICTPTQGFRK